MNQAMQTFESSMSCQGLIQGTEKGKVSFQTFFDYMMGEAIKYDKLNGADKKRPPINRRINKAEAAAATAAAAKKAEGDKKTKGKFAPDPTSPWFISDDKWAKMTKEARAEHTAKKRAAFVKQNGGTPANSSISAKAAAQSDSTALPPGLTADDISVITSATEPTTAPGSFMRAMLSNRAETTPQATPTADAASAATTAKKVMVYNGTVYYRANMANLNYKVNLLDASTFGSLIDGGANGSMAELIRVCSQSRTHTWLISRLPTTTTPSRTLRLDSLLARSRPRKATLFFCLANMPTTRRPRRRFILPSKFEASDTMLTTCLSCLEECSASKRLATKLFPSASAMVSLISK